MDKKSKTILIVEDDIIASTYLRGLLEEANYKCIDTAVSGEEALQKVQEIYPDLILMDMVLHGEMSGCEAVLKINKKNPNISIIILTAHINDEILRCAKESNACAYLMKPYRDNEILATIYLSLNKESKKKYGDYKTK